MKALERPLLKDLMRELGVESWPFRWNDRYDEVMSDYETN